MLLSTSSFLGVMSEESGSVWDPSVFWIWLVSFLVLFSVPESDISVLFGFFPSLFDIITSLWVYYYYYYYYYWGALVCYTYISL